MNNSINIESIYKVVSEWASQDVLGVVVVFSSKNQLVDGRDIQMKPELVLNPSDDKDHLKPEPIELQEEGSRLLKLLDAYRKRLNIHLLQKAVSGLTSTPPAIINDISDARVNIQRIKERLRAIGVGYHNEYTDDEESI